MTEAGMTAITLSGVTLGYPNRRVLTDINVTINQGEFIGLFGANGAGKTTLLRALLGLLRPQAGAITVLGAPATPGQPGVGTLPQTTDAPIPPVRGLDLLAASLRGAHWGLARLNAAGQADIAWALDQVNAAALARRRFNTLSGGERQRVLIAQALLGQPRVLLLDEPLAGLDPSHQHTVVTLLRDIQRRLGLTVLCSAHDVNVLLPAMDRVLYLGGGRAALGRVEDVVTAPVLTRLYGAPIEVLRAGGRIFVGAEAT
jgi:zinc/manganese transport system ATP-binding protein